MKTILEKIENKLNEAPLRFRNKLTDNIYAALEKIPEFKNLSLDRQGEITVKVAEMIGK
jgi:hypothetical protein